MIAGTGDGNIKEPSLFGLLLLIFTVSESGEERRFYQMKGIVWVRHFHRNAADRIYKDLCSSTWTGFCHAGHHYQWKFKPFGSMNGHHYDTVIL